MENRKILKFWSFLNQVFDVHTFIKKWAAAWGVCILTFVLPSLSWSVNSVFGENGPIELDKKIESGLPGADVQREDYSELNLIEKGLAESLLKDFHYPLTNGDQINVRLTTSKVLRLTHTQTNFIVFSEKTDRFYQFDEALIAVIKVPGVDTLIAQTANTTYFFDLTQVKAEPVKFHFHALYPLQLTKLDKNTSQFHFLSVTENGIFLQAVPENGSPLKYPTLILDEFYEKNFENIKNELKIRSVLAYNGNTYIEVRGGLGFVLYVNLKNPIELYETYEVNWTDSSHNLVSKGVPPLRVNFLKQEPNQFIISIGGFIAQAEVAIPGIKDGNFVRQFDQDGNQIVVIQTVESFYTILYNGAVNLEGPFPIQDFDQKTIDISNKDLAFSTITETLAIAFFRDARGDIYLVNRSYLPILDRVLFHRHKYNVLTVEQRPPARQKPAPQGANIVDFLIYKLLQ